MPAKKASVARPKTTSKKTVAKRTSSKPKADPVTTLCYGMKDTWEDRQDAIDHFLEGMRYSEGSEQARYTSVYLDLLAGNSTAWDRGERWNGSTPTHHPKKVRSSAKPIKDGKKGYKLFVYHREREATEVKFRAKDLAECLKMACKEFEGDVIQIAVLYDTDELELIGYVDRDFGQFVWLGDHDYEAIDPRTGKTSAYIRRFPMDEYREQTPKGYDPIFSVSNNKLFIEPADESGHYHYAETESGSSWEIHLSPSNRYIEWMPNSTPGEVMKKLMELDKGRASQSAKPPKKNTTKKTATRRR